MSGATDPELLAFFTSMYGGNEDEYKNLPFSDRNDVVKAFQKSREGNEIVFWLLFRIFNVVSPYLSCLQARLPPPPPVSVLSHNHLPFIILTLTI